MALHRVAPFDMQITTWDCDLAGDILEVSAMVAESRNPISWAVADAAARWDHGLGFVMGSEVWYGDELQPLRWWWALRWVADAVVQGVLVP